MVAEDLGACIHGPLRPCERRAVTSFLVASKSVRRRSRRRWRPSCALPGACDLGRGASARDAYQSFPDERGGCPCSLSRGNLDTLFAAVNAVRLGSRSLQRPHRRDAGCPESGGNGPLWLRLVIDLFCRQMKTVRTGAGCVFGLAKDRRGNKSRSECSNDS